MVKKTEIMERLAARGVTGLCTKRVLCKALHLGHQTIVNEIKAGRLKTVDENTLDFDGIVDWLMIRPRYIADKALRQNQDGDKNEREDKEVHGVA